MGWGVQAHLHHDRWTQVEYISFSSGGIMRIGTLVQNTHNLKLGIVVGLDNRHSNLIQVASDLGIRWIHVRYLEVICE